VNANALLQLGERAQRRWWLLATLRVFLAAATCGVGTLVLLLIARSLGLWHSASTDALVYVGGLFAAVLLIGLVLSWFRTPTTVQITALLDRDAGLDERLVTAVELTLGDEEPGLVASAALEDASRHLHRAQLRSALPLRWPRWAWALPLGALLSALLLSVRPVEPAVVGGVVIGTASVPSTLSSARVEDGVERVVAVLDLDPVRGRDPYVQAVAASLGELAQRVRDGEVEASAALIEFDRLMAHLQRAVSERPEDDPIATLVNRYFDQGASIDDGGRPDEAQVGRDGGDPSGASAPAADRRVQAAQNPTVRTLESLLEDLEQALSEAAAAVQAMPAAMVAEASSDDAFYAAEVDASQERQAAVQRQRGEAQGTPIGGAEESDERPGDAAGFGVQDGHGDESGGVTAEGSFGEEEVVVAGRELEGRRRVQIEGDPGGSASPRTGGASLETATPQHRIDDAVRMASSSSVYTAVVRTYFLPDAFLRVDAPQPLEER
jgi:hypothetical protein